MALTQEGAGNTSANVNILNNIVFLSRKENY